tara:strand:- start:8865 stop:9821 length:957 start_codon:yes stop_codon:yes gene_type:complete
MKLLKVLLCSLILTGCATTEHKEAKGVTGKQLTSEELEIILSKLDLTEENKNRYREKDENNLEKITLENYRDILTKNKNGVFQHPFYPNRVLTISRQGADISEQLEDLNLKESFDFQVGKYKFSKKGNTSTVGIHFLAQNRSKLDANAILLNKNHRIKHDPNKHHSYFVLLHEIAHSLDTQYEYLVMDRGATVFGENQSEIVASILMYQTIRAEGYDDKYFKKFMWREKRYALTFVATHRTQHVFPIMTDLILNNSEYFKTMSKPEIEDFSFKLTKLLYDNDYSNKKGLQNISSKYYKSSINKHQKVIAEVKREYSLD